jgi:hypothetical protein
VQGFPDASSHIIPTNNYDHRAINLGYPTAAPIGWARMVNIRPRQAALLFNVQRINVEQQHSMQLN